MIYKNNLVQISENPIRVHTSISYIVVDKRYDTSIDQSKLCQFWIFFTSYQGWDSTKNLKNKLKLNLNYQFCILIIKGHESAAYLSILLKILLRIFSRYHVSLKACFTMKFVQLLEIIV